MVVWVVESVDGVDATVVALLELAIGGGSDRVSRALEPYRFGRVSVAVTRAAGDVVGVVGYIPGCERTELVHIATAPQVRRSGAGAALVEWVREHCESGVVEAQTDGESLGFYRALGFEVESLGELYPGVERFAVTLRR
ncbi:GNAT family N-acetyltransferase [Rhodococcus sp. HNM0563]|uniref:GNAT family N-acetyltransferase n=1 Tax=Rhodococcus sp. HNM0563 TaxID=2716339 RepID=UPI00146CD2C3|nr:GNAT family N-acetyltransferase [Rhodococcus sp. HNM0563]NLU61306.1 GNAT family N-acetyltransferase [Rhodococcus sp. HNM0563]